MLKSLSYYRRLLNTVSTTGHLMGFHVSTALDYTEKSKMVRHMETKLKDRKTGSVAAFHLTALPPHLSASLKKLKVHNLKMLKLRLSQSPHKACLFPAVLLTIILSLWKVQMEITLQQKYELFLFLVNISPLLHSSALSLNQKPPDITQPPSKRQAHSNTNK